MDRALLRFPGNLDARDELGSAWVCIRQLNFSVVVPSLQRSVEAPRAFATAEDVYLALLAVSRASNAVPALRESIAVGRKPEPFSGNSVGIGAARFRYLFEGRTVVR